MAEKSFQFLVFFIISLCLVSSSLALSYDLPEYELSGSVLIEPDFMYEDLDDDSDEPLEEDVESDEEEMRFLYEHAFLHSFTYDFDFPSRFVGTQVVLQLGDRKIFGDLGQDKVIFSSEKKDEAANRIVLSLSFEGFQKHMAGAGAYPLLKSGDMDISFVSATGRDWSIEVSEKIKFGQRILIYTAVDDSGEKLFSVSERIARPVVGQAVGIGNVELSNTSTLLRIFAYLFGFMI